VAKPSAVSRAQKSKGRDSGHRRDEQAAGAGLARSERFRDETPRPTTRHAAENPGGPSKGAAGARSAGTTTETTDHEATRVASASLLTTQARGQRGAPA
jgi:hypothetical protein